MASDDETVLEATVESLVTAPDPNEIAARVTLGCESIDVTRKAKESMSTALDAMANQPTVFFKCEFAVRAVTEILGVDMLEYSMPQTSETLAAFDWEAVVAGRIDTYPQGESPTDTQFSKVRSVHTLVKEEKDAQAQAMGLPKSGVQSYCTYKQR